jgi:hypothetical protein
VEPQPVEPQPVEPLVNVHGISDQIEEIDSKIKAKQDKLNRIVGHDDDHDPID